MTAAAIPAQSWLQHYREAIGLLSRNARLYLTGAFLFGIAHAGYQLLFNLYLRERGLTESVIGGVLASTATGAALLALPAGFLLLRTRVKPVIITAVVLYVTALLFLVSWQDTEMLWLFAFSSGMAMTFYRVSTAPFYMRNSSETERPMLFSLGFAMIMLSGAVGSIGGGYLVDYFTHLTGDSVIAHRWGLYVSSCVGALAIIPLLMITSRRPSEEEKRQRIDWSALRGRLPLYGKLFTPFFLVGLGAGFIIPFLNIFFRDRFTKSADTIGLYFFGVQVATVIGTLAGPALVRKFGRIRTVVLTELVSVPFMLALVYTGELTIAVIAFLLRAAFMNMGQPVASNFTMEMVTKREQGLVNALIFLAWTGSWMVSTAVGGTLIEHYGYELPMVITAGLYSVSAGLYYFFFRKSERFQDGQFMVRTRGMDA
ncbi:MAG TPA: MFS transporter [candidate division Zixibacteria bacterium]|nr:MFS transporter [candidate division Zixibacteria bacterium]